MATSEDKAFASVADHYEPTPGTLVIADLLKEHRSAVDALRTLVADANPPEKSYWMHYDDLFYLRYILSFGSPKSAEAAVRETFRYRADPVNHESLKHVEDESWKDTPHSKLIAKFQLAGPVDGGQKTGGFTIVIRGSYTRQAAIQQNFTTDELVTLFMSWREAAYRINDEQTRKTGVLAKQVILFDMKGVSLSDMMDKNQATVHTNVSKKCALLYPQLQEAMVLVNAPGWMTMVLAFFRKLLPKRNMDKIRMFSSIKQMWGSKWAADTLEAAGVPDFLGGKLLEKDFPDGINGKLYQNPEEDESQELNVPARDSREVRVTCPAGGGQLHYRASLANYGVNMEVVLHHGRGEGVEACESPDGRTTTLFAQEKIGHGEGVRKGTWDIAKPGVVVVTFDNSYSMLRSKTVNYAFQYALPEGSVDELKHDGEGELVEELTQKTAEVTLI